MSNIKIINDEVYKLLNTDNSGHGMEHVNRVGKIALSLSDDDVNKDIVEAVALLHDADDYKLFGIENANNLTNTKIILSKTSFTEEEQDIIINSIKTIGYSKRISGIVPSIKEAMIVSDADMLDAMGAIGILRSFQYNIAHGNTFFDRNDFPNLELTPEEYKNKKEGTVVNHLFEKILKLRDLMLTDKGKNEAIRRYDFIVSFLSEYFHEVDASEWKEYLDDYTQKLIKK